MVAVVFKDPVLYAYNNGYWSQPLAPSRGCRQGCSLSPILFTYIVEILGIAIRQDEDIEGIKIGEANIKSGQFADDLWASLVAKEKAVNAMLQVLERYSKFAGLKINSEKCAVLRIGPWKNSEARFYTMKKLFWSPKSVTILGFKICPNYETMIKENLIDKLDTVEQILNSWKSRGLTLIGKITVINHRVNTLFIHKLVALLVYEDEFYKEYKRKILDFLWGSGVARISYEKLVQEYERGGLKLVDLRTKEIALKCAWVIKNKQKDMNWFYNNFTVKDDRIWQCNIDSVDLRKTGKEFKLSSAYAILLAWVNYNYESVLSDPGEILNTSLWGNSLIRRASKPIFDHKITQSNTDHIEDIYNYEQKKFWNFVDLVGLYGKQFDELYYCGLKAAIPKMWKVILSNSRGYEEGYESKVDFLTRIEQKHVTKTVYWEMIRKNFNSVQIARQLWMIDLHINIEEEEWEALFVKFRQGIKPTKLQWFQYKLFNRALTTNVRLSKWKKEVSVYCSFCHHKPETVVHLLCECDVVKPLWRNLKATIKHFWEEEIELNQYNIVLNNFESQNEAIINLLVVTLKQYIYASRCLQETPTFSKFMTKVSNWYQVEKCILYQNYSCYKEKRFYKKWKNIY